MHEASMLGASLSTDPRSSLKAVSFDTASGLLFRDPHAPCQPIDLLTPHPAGSSDEKHFLHGSYNAIDNLGFLSDTIPLFTRSRENSVRCWIRNSIGRLQCDQCKNVIAA
jgi:hypothetical protein